MNQMMDEMNGCDDFHLSPNSLLSTFETSIDEELNFAFSQMVDNNDPWIGNGICDQINIFGHDMFDEDFNTDSSKSSSASLSPQPPVNIKCEVEIDNEIEINSEDCNDCDVDSPISYAGSSTSSSSSHNYDYPQVVLISAQNIKKEPKDYCNSNKSSPKTSPKTRTPRNIKITDLVLTDEEKRLLAKEGYHDFPSGSLPLTKQEEKILRKIRRKIRNKKSAQCSRQRKKEYLEDLERRFDDRNHENEQLKKEVIKLKKENDTLLMKMKKLLSMNGQNASFKSSFFVIILSFLLILVPYFRPEVEEFGLHEKELVGTGRHLLMALYSGEPLNSLESNDTFHNITSSTISNSNLL